MPTLLPPIAVLSTPKGTNPALYGLNGTWTQTNQFGPQIIAGPYCFVDYKLNLITPDGVVSSNGSTFFAQAQSGQPYFSELNGRLFRICAWDTYAVAQQFNGTLTQAQSNALPFFTAASAYANPWGMIGLSNGNFPYVYADDKGGCYTYLLSGEMGYIDATGVLAPVPGATYYSGGQPIFSYGNAFSPTGSYATGACGFYLPKTGEIVAMLYNAGVSGGSAKAQKMVVVQKGAVPVGTITDVPPLGAGAAYMGRLFDGVVIIAPFGGATGAYYTEDMVSFAPLHDINGHIVFENVYNETSARAVHGFGADYIAVFGSVYGYQIGPAAAAYVLQKSTKQASPSQLAVGACSC